MHVTPNSSYCHVLGRWYCGDVKVASLCMCVYVRTSVCYVHYLQYMPKTPVQRVREGKRTTKIWWEEQQRRACIVKLLMTSFLNRISLAFWLLKGISSEKRKTEGMCSLFPALGCPKRKGFAVLL